MPITTALDPQGRRREPAPAQHRDHRLTQRNHHQVLPALGMLLPLHGLVLGLWVALAHAVLGFAGAIVMLEAVMVHYDKVPFTCTCLPSENMKALAPLYGFGFILGASYFAQMQHAALQSGNPARLLPTLAALRDPPPGLPEAPAAAERGIRRSPGHVPAAWIAQVVRPSKRKGRHLSAPALRRSWNVGRTDVETFVEP